MSFSPKYTAIFKFRCQQLGKVVMKYHPLRGRSVNQGEGSKKKKKCVNVFLWTTPSFQNPYFDVKVNIYLVLDDWTTSISTKLWPITFTLITLFLSSLSRTKPWKVLWKELGMIPFSEVSCLSKFLFQKYDLCYLVKTRISFDD